jgi:hypothetical protein
MHILKAGVLNCEVLLLMMGVRSSNAATIQNFDSGCYTASGFTAGVANINVGSTQSQQCGLSQLACVQCRRYRAAVGRLFF